jgi:hypothetical protein
MGAVGSFTHHRRGFAVGLGGWMRTCRRCLRQVFPMEGLHQRIGATCAGGRWRKCGIPLSFFLPGLPDLCHGLACRTPSHGWFCLKSLL